MGKLEVRENKKLVLKNVIVYEIRDISMDALDDEINKFLNKIKVLNVQTFGPLVTKNFGAQVQEDGNITISYDVMVQAHDFNQYKNTYKVYERIVAEYCVYVRFEDHPQYLNHAYSKLDLHFYENDLESDGTIYNVLVNETESFITMDIFRPVQQI